MKRQYELMVVVKTDFPADDEKKREALLTKLVGKEATLVDSVVFGKKRFAYPIQKLEEGYYILATVEGKVIVSAIEREIKLGTDVLRYLLTVKN